MGKFNPYKKDVGRVPMEVMTERLKKSIKVAALTPTPGKLSHELPGFTVDVTSRRGWLQQVCAEITFLFMNQNSLRASRLHLHLGAPSAPGLSNYLNGRADEFSIFQADPKVELFFVAAGGSVQNPSELLANETLRGFLDRVTRTLDWVIVDGPPVLAGADAGVVAEFCDGVIVVVRAGATAHDLVKTALQKFPGNHLFGVVLNGADEKPTHASYFHYVGFGMDRQ